MASENPVQRKIWLFLGSVSRLFRLNSGRAWLSSLGPRGVQRLEDGSVLIKAARSISIGLSSPKGDTIAGVGDLIGWTTVEITPDMVGRRVAVFTSIEVKASKGGVVSPNQDSWCNQVCLSGGIAGIANSQEAAMNIIDQWICNGSK